MAQRYTTESSRTVHDSGFSQLRIDTVRTPDGEIIEREVIGHLDAVAVVPVDRDGTVVLVRQYRHAVGQRLLEIPAGLLDVDAEAPAAAAHRELAEEVGLAAGRLEYLTRFHNSAGWSDERTTIYLGQDLSDAVADGFVAEHEEADMEIVRMPLDELVAMASAGDLSDAKTVVGVLLAARRLG